jgi:hypothetical protein
MTTAVLKLPGASLADEREDLGEELRTVGMVWERELIRFFRTRARVLSASSSRSCSCSSSATG